MKRLIRIAAAGALAAALGSCSMFDYSGMVTHKYALVYGVTRYTMGAPANSAPNLTYPDADAVAIASALASNGYTVASRWVDGNGHIWVNGIDSVKVVGALQTDGTTISGENPDPAVPLIVPSKTNILADIQALAPTLGRNDILVVYFSGHGTQDSPGTSPLHEYFDPYGSVMQDIQPGPDFGKYFDYPAPSVRDDDLRAAFDAVATPRKVLILDTCNSGGFIGNTLEVDTTPPAYTGGPPLVGPGTLFQAISNYASMQSSPTGLSPYGAQVLSAAGRDELSYEAGSPFNHGIMTYYLLLGLQGSAADLNHDGHVTVLEAFAYAKAGIDQNWNSNSGIVASGWIFEPHVSGGPVDFVLF